MNARRIWTLEEANALLPTLSELVGQQLERAAEIERRWNELQSAARSAQAGARASAPEPVLAVEPSARRAPEHVIAVRPSAGHAPGGSEPVAAAAPDPEGVGDLERELQERIRSYEAGWDAVEALGAVVKDARSGLCDFYGQVDGRYVWLCWRYGEPSIGFYHDLDAGFSGRKPLTPAARLRQLN